MESMFLLAWKAGIKHYFTATHIERAVKCALGRQSVELRKCHLFLGAHELGEPFQILEHFFDVQIELEGTTKFPLTKEQNDLIKIKFIISKPNVIKTI